MTWEEDLGRYEADCRQRGIQTGPRMSYLGRLGKRYDRPLMDLSAGEINGWIGSLSASLATHKTVVAHVKNALKFLNGGTMPPVCKRIVARRGSVPSRVLAASDLPTSPEIDQLIASTPRADLRALIALSVGSGARPSELLRLHRDDVTEGTVKGAPVLRLAIRRTKTGDPRTVTVFDPRALHFMAEWSNGRDEGPLWEFRDYAAWTKVLKRLAKTAGLTRINWYPYLLRHMRGTQLYDAPADVRDAQMGWKPGSGQAANYTHLRPDQWEDALFDREGEVVEEPTEELKRILTQLRDFVERNPKMGYRFEEVPISGPGDTGLLDPPETVKVAVARDLGARRLKALEAGED